MRLYRAVGGNVSLRFIPVSFNQAIGATTPFFTALLSLFIMRQKETLEVYLTLIPIVLGGGITHTSYDRVTFD